MVLRPSSIAFMAIAILFLCLVTFVNAENTRQLHGSRSRHQRRANVISSCMGQGDHQQPRSSEPSHGTS
ncbi:hypothetical protein LB505_008111 [Fusarium chuoi]|nr:hypothetical protein LB505_008111 [Fusarium chuoi]